MTRALGLTAAIWLAAFALVSTQPSRWWLDEPVRFLQTTLREIDSTVDPRALVAEVAAFQANTFLVNMGGIVAQYPLTIAREGAYRTVTLPTLGAYDVMVVE